MEFSRIFVKLYSDCSVGAPHALDKVIISASTDVEAWRPLTAVFVRAMGENHIPTARASHFPEWT